MWESEKRGEISRVVKDLRSMQKHREALPAATFLSLRQEWKEAAEAIKVNQTDLVSMGLEGENDSSSSREKTAIITKKQSQILVRSIGMQLGQAELYLCL